jgi:hypothetical protein
MATRYGWMADTSEEAFAKLIELQRNMTPGQKLTLIFQEAERMLGAERDHLRRQYPEADERAIFLRAAARRLGRETMIKAYGSDPEAYDRPSC